MSEEHLLDSSGGGASVHIPLRTASVADDSTAPLSFVDGPGRHARLASLLQAYELAGEMSIADAQAVEMCLGGGGGEIASAFGDEQPGDAGFESHGAVNDSAATDIAPHPRPRSKNIGAMEASALKSMLLDRQPSAVASADSIAANTAAAMHAEQSWWCAECFEAPSRTGAYVTDALRRWRARLPYYIPIFDWLPKYTRAKLIGDAAGGISAGFLALASGIALGGIAHSDALHGMYTAFYPSLIYTIFGSGSRINFGPETIVGTLYGQAIETLKENPDFKDPASRVGLEQTFSFLVGASVLVLGILRLGFLDSILAHTVVTGLVNAIIITLLIDQTPKLLGFTFECDCVSYFSKSIQIVSKLKETAIAVVIVSSVAFGVMIFIRLLKKRYEDQSAIIKYTPAPLVVLTLGVSFSFALDLQGAFGVPVLGSASSGFQPPSLPNFNLKLGNLYVPALVTGLLNFIESFLCAKMFAARYGETVSPNREMVAIGLANAASSFFGTFPASASLSRTTLAAQNGAQTPAAGFFSALVVAFGIAFLLPLIAKLPVCVASAMICDAVFYVIDFHELILLVRMRLWQDVALFLTIFLGTLQFGVDDSIFLALGGCMMLLVRSVAVIQPKIVVLGRLSAESVRLKSERFRKARELHEERKEIANATDRGDDAGSTSLLDNVSSLFLLKKYESKHGRGAASLAADSDDADAHGSESGDRLSQLRPHVRSVREQRFLGLSSSPSIRFSSLSSSMSSSIDATVAMECPHDEASSASASASSRRLAYEYVDITEFPQAQSVPGVLMVKLSGALNFATIGRIQLLFRRFLAPLDMDSPADDEMGLAVSDADDIVQLGNSKNSNMEDVAIDMVEVISLDGSAVSVFVSLLREAMLGGRRVCLGGLRENVLKLLLRIPEFRRIMRDMLYATLHEAVTALE